MTPMGPEKVLPLYTKSSLGDLVCFFNNELIGYQRIYYCPDNKTLECSSVWLARKYW